MKINDKVRTIKGFAEDLYGLDGYITNQFSEDIFEVEFVSDGKFYDRLSIHRNMLVLIKEQFSFNLLPDSIKIKILMQDNIRMYEKVKILEAEMLDYSKVKNELERLKKSLYDKQGRNNKK